MRTIAARQMQTASRRAARRCQRGMALPLALLAVLLFASAGTLLTRTTVESWQTVKMTEATADTFEIAEGVLHDLLRQMSSQPHLWRDKTALATLPSGYTQYSPSINVASNGIPSCSGIACHRCLYPTGGGLLKNFGPIGGDGDQVNNAVSIVQQLNTAALPAADVTLNGRQAWGQVERLDETTVGASSIGADLTNNPGAGNSSAAIRFRLTGTTLRAVQGQNGRATLVIVAELPAA